MSEMKCPCEACNPYKTVEQEAIDCYRTALRQQVEDLRALSSIRTRSDAFEDVLALIDATREKEKDSGS